MNNFGKRLSALVLTTLFATMQISYAAVDTGLGAGHGGAVINGAAGGFDPTTGISGAGTGNVNLNFTGDAHVKWDTLNVNSGESLNFNAVNGANGVTVLNTVNRGMSNIYGQINANKGVSNLIISNPNGVLFNGAKFTTAGDVMVTTKDMSNVTLEDLAKGNLKGNFTQLKDANGKLVTVNINNSNFEIGGDYTIVSPGIVAADSIITAKTIKLITADGQSYVDLGMVAPYKEQTVARLKAMNVNGDLYITNDVGALEFTNGGTVNGNVKILTSGDVVLNKVSNQKKLVINGDADIKNNGAQMFLRNAEVDGNLYMANGGGFLDVGNLHVTKNATLKTEVVSDNNLGCENVNHFVHVLGKTNIDGDLNIESKDNIHIGGYDITTKKLADGKLTVGGDLNAHAHDGHVMTTIDTSANKISLKSDNRNVLSDGKAILSAKEYEFSSNGYIGGLTTTEQMSLEDKIINIMENYIPIPDTVGTPANINITGGTISKIETPVQASTYISSNADVKLTGANAGYIYITAPVNYIEITGNDVHANTITVGKETKTLKVDFPSRDYELKYTNIRDSKETVIKPNDEITYNLTNAKNGYNDGNQVIGMNTYLVGPNKPIDPPNPPGPDIPDTPNPPGPPTLDPDDNENVKVLRSFENRSVDLNQVYTPVAYAADLDDDKLDTAVRKNVDGSVTVVRAFPMID